MVTHFVLVHSPLVGPTTWKWVAEELRSDGHTVVVPAASRSTLSAGWEGFVSDVAGHAANTSDAVFVGHSGAGPLLPNIVDRARAVRPVLVFVDASVPPERDSAQLMPAEMLEDLRLISHDGALPPWSEWFGPEVMDALVPDAAKRRLVTAELPRVPLDYFTGSVPPVCPWPATQNGYVLLSDAYRDAATEAARRGWRVVEKMGGHLDIVTHARSVTDAICSIVPMT